MKSSELKGKYDEAVGQALAAIQANGDQRQLAAISVCDEVVATLVKMETNLLEGVKAGLIEICEQIAAEQTTPGTPERVVLERVAGAIKGLTEAVSEAFKQHRDVVEYNRDRFILGKVKAE